MINLPIKRFKLKENKVIINNLIVEYEDISEDNREILESLISKGAYGSALLTLNSFYNVKKINEAECSHSEYLSYLNECNNLMKECVVETDKAHNFRPLINLNGFEIMESADHIARGKGDKLLVEDFRLNESEGTQCSDIASRKDQSVGKLQRPPKKKKFKKVIDEALEVPRNHGFKGFMMNESGFYTRGNYVLIKEGKTIKAVNKKSLENK